MLPAVITLPIHLKGLNVAAYNNQGSGGSLLVRWLKMRPVELEDVTYLDYYQDYVVYNGIEERDDVFEEVAFGRIPVRRISRRSRGIKIAHLRHIMPSKGEVYYLRAILRDGRIARTWTGLREVDGRIYQDYQSAAIAAGLFNDFAEAQTTLREAIELMRTPAQLRFLYVQLILDGTAPAQALYEEFSNNLNADFRHLNANAEVVEQQTIAAIGVLLNNLRRTLEEFGFPVAIKRGIRLQEEITYWQRRGLRVAQDLAAAVAVLNEEQTNWLRSTQIAILYLYN